MSGGKDGALAFWDINNPKPFKSAKTHKGKVSKIHFYSDRVDTNLILSGGVDDGVLASHDMRTNKVVWQEKAHSGAINFLGSTDTGIVVSASSDKTVKLWDTMNGMTLMGEMKTTDCVSCGDIWYNLVFLGCVDGNLLAFNIDT